MAPPHPQQLNLKAQILNQLAWLKMSVVFQTQRETLGMGKEINCRKWMELHNLRPLCPFP
jgi:hypothetical protein